MSTFLSLQVHKATFSPSETWKALQELDKVMLFLISPQISYRTFYRQLANILKASNDQHESILRAFYHQRASILQSFLCNQLRIQFAGAYCLGAGVGSAKKKYQVWGPRCNTLVLEYLQSSKFAEMSLILLT